MAADHGPSCHNTDCTETARVHWQRRLTPAEVEAGRARELARRTEWPSELAESEPLPDGSTYSYIVEACELHAIDPDAAALVHQASCSGPNNPGLPLCDCTPEQQLPAQP